MENLFHNFLYYRIMFNYVLYFSGVLRIYRIRLPQLSTLKLREITLQKLFSI